jgi:hypothetical protein
VNSLLATMSRPSQPMSIETNRGDLEEEEAISGAGEGDEVMEEVEEQEEGYSTSLSARARPAPSPRLRLATDGFA